VRALLAERLASRTGGTALDAGRQEQGSRIGDGVSAEGAVRRGF
jgi:hypothetical protein